MNARGFRVQIKFDLETPTKLGNLIECPYEPFYDDRHITEPNYMPCYHRRCRSNDEHDCHN